VGGVNGFGYGSSGDSLVGHWHGILAGALAEEPPVGRPVFALHGAADGGAAERVMRGRRPQGGAARQQCLGVAHCPAQRAPPMVRVRVSVAVGQ